MFIKIDNADFDLTLGEMLPYVFAKQAQCLVQVLFEKAVQDRVDAYQTALSSLGETDLNSLKAILFCHQMIAKGTYQFGAAPEPKLITHHNTKKIPKI